MTAAKRPARRRAPPPRPAAPRVRPRARAEAGHAPRAETVRRGPVIDLHAHVFNMRYLPLVGTIMSFDPPRVPRAVAEAVKVILEEIAARPQPGPESAERVRRAEDEAGLVRLVAEAAPPEVVDRPEVRAALLSLDEGDLVHLELAHGPGAARALGLMADGRGAAPTPEAVGPLAALAVAAILWKLGEDLLKWLFLLTRRESDIARELGRAYPQVDVFVHHMMDMDVHYKDASEYPFPEQVRRMLALQADPAMPDLVVFTAFDPYRPDGFARVRDALGRGCAGVKYYPSNGFKPWDNGPEDVDDLVAHPPTHHHVNAQNEELYAHCVAHRIPLFAHCERGAMEARPGYDRKADPRWWRAVLDHRDGSGTRVYRDLFLCFAHGGGGDQWALPWSRQADFLASYAGEVFRLCVETEPDGSRRYPNVFCDFGMCTAILDRAGRDHLRQRLETLLTQHPVLAESIVFGTDWSMLYRLQDNEKYVNLFLDLFRRDGLFPHADRFFYQNARRFLNLPSYLQRMGPRVPPRMKAIADTVAAWP